MVGNFSKVWFVVGVVLLFCAAHSWAASVENLDEVIARKSRLATASWGYTLLENSSNYYTWQPETLTYNDVTTGNEVWRMTYDPLHIGGENHDIANTHWSANGNRLLIHSYRTTAAFQNYSSQSSGINPAWFLINADGSKLKPALNAAAELATIDGYVAWSPITADVLYQQGTNDQQSLPVNNVYKVTVSDTTISRALWLTIPGSNPRISLKKSISADGSTLFVNDINNGLWFPANVLTQTLLSSNGYAQLLNFDNYWGQSYGTFQDYHDQYTTGAVNGIDGIWHYLMPEGSLGSFGNLWRSRPIGSGTNNSPVLINSGLSSSETPVNNYYPWDHTNPLWDGSTVEVVNTDDGGMVPTVNDPWCYPNTISGTDCQQYTGHVSPDRWGHYILFEQTNDAPYGIAHYDARTHKYKSVNTTMENGDHTDWEAWSDWTVSDGSTSFSDSWLGTAGVKRLYIQTYQGIGSCTTTQNPLESSSNIWNCASAQEVAYTHECYNTGLSTRQGFLGPIQSPDGTKIQYVTSFMNADDNSHQLFWAVAYYPYPPQIQSAAKNGSNVQITWDFNQGSACASQSTSATRTGPAPNFTNPRTYATRGWPHETLDCPPSPRETKQFRVWVSTDNSTWSPVGTTTYNNCNGTNECGMWAQSSWTYNYAQPVSSTVYYAVTSLENSGLESHTLSNVWKVVTDGSGNIASQVQQAAYPANPGSKASFHTTAPAAPTGISFSPTATAGQYNIQWTAPANNTLIRYYNIYAHDGSAPTAISQNRIASIPVTASSSSFSYLDWLGNTDGATQYLVTSVDYQGNESSLSAAPTVTSFTLPETATSLTVPIISFTATDNVGVTGYLVTQSSTTPSACARGWSSTAPTSFTFSASGKQIAYAWAKDAAGNISAAKSSSVTITLPKSKESPKNRG